jgi:tetratricopeptide (TPR) repeat protein
VNFLFPLKLGLSAGLLIAACLATPLLARAAGELHQAEQLVEAGRAAEAIALVQRYGKSSDASWAQVHSAALLASGQSRRAVDLLAPLHAADPLNLGLANNYAVALEAIGATDTARQVLERALGDGAATAAAFRNLRSLYAKLAAAAYARAVDAPVQRMSPTLALVMPSDRQALAFTPGAGDQSPAISRGPAPAPAIPPMAALGPEASPANRPPSSPTPYPTPSPTTASTGPGSNKATGSPTPPPLAVAAAPVAPSAPPVTPVTSPMSPKPAEKPTDKAAEKPPEKAPPKASDKTAESAAEKPVNDRQAAALAQLERATANWAAAWSRKDVPAYLAFYARGFQPPPGLSRSEWEKQRHERLNRPGSIKVTIDDLKVVTDGDGWRVTFRQHYRATGLESTATKSMRWVHEGGRWLIQAERAQ